MTNYTTLVDRDPVTKLLVGYVPGFPGAHTQAETLDELQANLREVIEMLLEDGGPKLEAEFVGTQSVSVAVSYRVAGSSRIRVANLTSH